MKLRLLLCGAALLAAGCNSPESPFAATQNPYATSGEFSYTYDYVPEPIPDIPPTELERIYQNQVPGTSVTTSASVASESGGR
jgi:hypothetical protein